MMKIRTKKKLGQHFLNNDDIAKKIISYHSNRKNVLEIGSGRGGGAMHVLKYLKPETIVGIDISKEAIRLCDSFYKAPGLSFMIGDSENLPFKNNTFDVVINVESSHCYGNIPQFLSEVQRVLNPNGFFLWADFRTRNEMDMVFNLFSNSGLALIREKNITKNKFGVTSLF